ncbi:MAG: heavy-metal-associated domain-containing protein [Bacteroidales bacterium]|jgi:copper chaperone CopZ|nr:heavy-metal-associated domain-containing protein [Bacteroidales bacterium]
MKKLSSLLAALFVFAALNLNAQVNDAEKAPASKNEKQTEAKSCCSKANASENCLTYSKDIKAKEGENLVLIKADIHCDNCKNKVEKQMSYAKGVKDVKADVASKSVTIAYDPKKTNEATLLKEVQALDMGGEIVPVKPCASSCQKKHSAESEKTPAEKQPKQ